jgi:hypothetical protein
LPRFEEKSRLRASLPPGLVHKGVGLGWFRFDHQFDCLGHDGAGMNFVRVVSDQDIVFVLLTNGGDASKFFERVFHDVLQCVAGIAWSTPPHKPRTGGRVPEFFIGEYSNMGLDVSIGVNGNALTLRSLAVPGTTSVAEKHVHRLVELDNGSFMTEDGSQRYAFLGEAGRRAKWLQYGIRALKRRPNAMR